MEDAGVAFVRPTFSVIMPVYNCRQWIREAVISVLAQTEQDFELIVVDDCSTDGSVEAISDLVSRDCRIRLIRRTTNGNAATARNTGLEVSTGSLIAFLDADDLWLPTRLSSHLTVFKAYPEASMVFSDFRGFGGALGEEPPYLTAQRDLLKVSANHLDGPFRLPGSNLEIYRCRESLSTFIAINYSLMYPHSVTLSRTAVMAQPYWFPQHLAVCEDLEFFLRILENGFTIFLSETLAWYRQRSGSLTALHEGFFRGMIQFHSANLERRRTRFTLDEVRAYKVRIAALRTSLAWQLSLTGAAAESRQQYWLAFRTSPSWSGAIGFAKSLIPIRMKKKLAKFREVH